jgi:hypothetical protein
MIGRSTQLSPIRLHTGVLVATPRGRLSRNERLVWLTLRSNLTPLVGGRDGVGCSALRDDADEAL